MSNQISLRKISEIKVPKMMFNPYKIGNKHLDDLFSENGGIVPSMIILLTGQPGGGKTTLSCLIASGVSKNLQNTEIDNSDERPNGPVVLIYREMSDFQIKLLERKLGHGNNLDDVIILGDQEPGNYLDWLELLTDLEPSLIILDSLQKHAAELSKGTINNNQKSIVNAFQEFSKIMYTSVILIGHVSKSGQYIGPSNLKHTLDAHLQIDIDNHTGDKTIQMEKNRFGKSFMPIFMDFTNDGVVIEGNPLQNISENSNESNLSLSESLKVFHQRNSNRDTIHPVTVKSFLSNLFEYLKKEYKSDLEKNEITVNNIKLEFNNSNKLFCDITTNTIYVGLGGIKNIKAMHDSDYEYENIYMSNICLTKEDKLIWMFLHEFTHLLFPSKSFHTIEFFQEIYKIAETNSFLFTTNDGTFDELQIPNRLIRC